MQTGFVWENPSRILERLACSGAGLAAGVLRQAGLVVPVFLRDEQRSEINWAGKKVVKDEFTEVVTFELDFEK